MTYRFI